MTQVPGIDTYWHDTGARHDTYWHDTGMTQALGMTLTGI